MKKLFCLFCSLFLIIVFYGCGDNKTKEKLIGTQIITESSSPSTYSATLAANSATMVSRMGQGTGSYHSAPKVLQSAIYQAIPPGMSGPDGERYYLAQAYGSTVRIKFMDANSQPLTFDQVKAPPYPLRKLSVKIASQYTYGTWNGDFNIDKSSGIPSAPEIVTSGTITSADPVGGSFTATIAAGMQMDTENPVILPDGSQVHVPKSGSMTLVSGIGYNGTMTYSKDVNGNYTCTGDLYLADGTKVASVFLTYSSTFANYTGYYIDANGEQHSIGPQ